MKKSAKGAGLKNKNKKKNKKNGKKK